jgi:hypothetical protein
MVKAWGLEDHGGDGVVDAAAAMWLVAAAP